MDNLSGHFLCGDQSIPYVLERSARRKRTVALRIEQTRVRITAPHRTSQRMVEQILHRRAEWILRQLDYIRQHAQPAAQYQDGGKLLFLGQLRTITTTCDPAKSLDCGLQTDQLMINLHSTNLTTDDLAAEIKTETTLWLKKQARVILAERLHHWAQITQLTPTRLQLSSAESRWGSCDVKNIIRLNWRLVMFHPDLIDYVVVHELCHIPHKNHGADFWNLLAKFMPDYKQRRQRLKQDGMMLH